MVIIKKTQYISLRIWPSKAELHHHGWTTFRLSLAYSQPASQAKGGSCVFRGRQRMGGTRSHSPLQLWPQSSSANEVGSALHVAVRRDFL